MGKENAGTISPTSPILDSIGRRKSVAYTNDRIKEMILKAPFIETVEKIGGSDEGDGDRESFASALSLWITDVIVPDVRKEVLNESEKEAQQAVRVVQTEMKSVLAVNKEILGRGSPEECEKIFDERMEKTRERARRKAGGEDRCGSHTGGNRTYHLLQHCRQQESLHRR